MTDQRLRQPADFQTDDYRRTVLGLEHAKELAAQGNIPPKWAEEAAQSIALARTRCRCGHLEGAHRGVDEPYSSTCRAHRCACGGFVADPRYTIVDSEAPK